MLNRKLSDYLYYGTLLLIVILVFLIRFILLSNLNGQIETVDADNISLQAQIEHINELVQENKDVQTAQVYELYDVIPNVYSSTSLTYKVVSLLEELGVDESDDMQRNVFISDEVSLVEDSLFFQLTQEYFVAEVQVTFTTQDGDIVNEFVDGLFNSEQLFIIRSLNYTVPDEENFIFVEVYFLAVYNLEDTEEVTASE